MSEELFTALWCIAGAGVIAIVLACWHRRDHGPAELDMWQRTAADVARDTAAARAAQDLTTCLAIWHATDHTIPNPRTEDNQ